MKTLVQTVAALALIAAVGCGGAGGVKSVTTGSAKTGTFSISVKWPARSKLVPMNANTVRVLVIPSTSVTPSTPISTFEGLSDSQAWADLSALNVSTSTGLSSTFTGAGIWFSPTKPSVTPQITFVPGSYFVIAEAYQPSETLATNSNVPTTTLGAIASTDHPIAQVAGVMQINAGQNTPDTFTMGSTVAQASVTLLVNGAGDGSNQTTIPLTIVADASGTGTASSSITVREDQAFHVLATPQDADGNTILVGPTEWTISTTSPLQALSQTANPPLNDWIIPTGSGSATVSLKYSDPPGSATALKTFKVPVTVTSLAPTLIKQQAAAANTWITGVATAFVPAINSFADLAVVATGVSGQMNPHSNQTTFTLCPVSPVSGIGNATYTFSPYAGDKWLAFPNYDPNRYIDTSDLSQGAPIRLALESSGEALACAGQPRYGVIPGAATGPAANSSFSSISGMGGELSVSDVSRGFVACNSLGAPSTVLQWNDGTQTATASPQLAVNAVGLAVAGRDYFSTDAAGDGLSAYLLQSSSLNIESSPSGPSPIASLSQTSSVSLTGATAATAVGDILLTLENGQIVARNPAGAQLSDLSTALSGFLGGLGLGAMKPYAISAAGAGGKINVIVSFIAPALTATGPDQASSVVIFSLG